MLPCTIDYVCASCSSRKGTEETSSCLLSSGVRRGYKDTDAQRAALADAAARLENTSLAHAVRSGIAFHHGNLCAGDRALVEALFLDRAIAVSITAQPCISCILGGQSECWRLCAAVLKSLPQFSYSLAQKLKAAACLLLSHHGSTWSVSLTHCSEHL